MNNNNLTSEEEKQLENFISTVEAQEAAQVEDLIANCDNKYQFAKTHSTYVKDWEKTRKQMEERANSGNLPPGTSPALVRAMIEAGDKIIEKKLKKAREAFIDKFGESVYDGYLGPDGKTKGLFGGLFK